MPWKSTEAVKRWRKAHPERVRASANRRRKERRIRALRFLSGAEPHCACCGWDQIDGRNRLEFDHINGGGRKLTAKSHSANVSMKILRGEAGFRVLCRACNAIMEPGATNCVLHLPLSTGRPPRFSFLLGSPSVYGPGLDGELTKHSTMCAEETINRRETMSERVKDLTTIQLKVDTRDRLYRLKFRKTYDEFLRELCELYEASAADGRK